MPNSKPNPVTRTETLYLGEKDQNLNPTSDNERISSLDILRGIAVLGILIMNIVGFGLAFANDDPTVAGGASGANLFIWAFNEVFVEGTMRGLFTMLFGLGFLLFISRGEKKGAGLMTADYYYRRILWLLVFGVIHAYILLWHGDILFTYAICGMMLFAFRTASPKFLIIFGVLLLFVGTLKYVDDYMNVHEIQQHGKEAEALAEKNIQLNDAQTFALEEWKSIKSKNAEVKQENKIMRQDYLSIMKYRYPRSIRNQTVNLFNYNIWDSLAFMLFGMAFYTWGILQARRSYNFYIYMMVIGYTIGLTVNISEISMIVSSNFDPVVLSKSKLTFHLGRLFTTFGHIGLIMIFVKSGFFRFGQNALANVGRMAFTNYLGQTVICGIIFMGFGFGQFGKMQRYELYYVVVAVWIFQLIFSSLWLRYFKYGPMEWIWRCLTYSKIFPIRRYPQKVYKPSLQR